MLLKASCVLYVSKGGLHCNCIWNSWAINSNFSPWPILLSVTFQRISLRKLQLRDSPAYSIQTGSTTSPSFFMWLFMGVHFVLWSYGRRGNAPFRILMGTGELSSLMHKPSSHELVPKTRKWTRHLLNWTLLFGPGHYPTCNVIREFWL